MLSGNRLWEVMPLASGAQLAENHQSVYIVATEADHDVLYLHGIDLYNAYTATHVDGVFWALSDVPHAETVIYFYDEYMHRIDIFVRRVTHWHGSI